MGTVISLSDHRAARSAADAGPGGPTRLPVTPATVLYDVGSPMSYLVAERADRLLPGASWQPVVERTCTGRPPGGAAVLVDAERRAGELGIPLTWPERWPTTAPGGLRVAELAAERGRGAAFALAALRLQFSGGFDLDDPEILAEAAGAAGICLDEALVAARDATRDVRPERHARALRASGATALPAFRVRGRLVFGEDRLAEVVVVAGHGAQPLAFPSWRA